MSALPPSKAPTANPYFHRVEERTDCPVARLSTSPERDDTILVRDPFAG